MGGIKMNFRRSFLLFIGRLRDSRMLEKLRHVIIFFGMSSSSDDDFEGKRLLEAVDPGHKVAFNSKGY